VQHEHASRLSGARFRAEEKKEHEAPPNYARPCHFGKGRHARNKLVQISKKKRRLQVRHLDGRVQPYHALAERTAFRGGRKFISKINGKDFLLGRARNVANSAQGRWWRRKIVANWPAIKR
jgi:hypothetical protein